MHSAVWRWSENDIMAAERSRGIRIPSRSTAHTTYTQSWSSNVVRNYHAEWPPSIRKSLPVMKELPSDIKKMAAPRYSSGADNRPNMFCVGQSRRRSGYFSNSASTMAVTIYPGDMVFTRIPNWPHSEARFRESCNTPAFDAL